MQSKYHRIRIHAILVLLLALTPVVVVAATNYIVDPLQIYRKQRFVEPCFWNEQRSQNAGKIRNYLTQDGYDSIILGNSVADNFRPSRVAKALGWTKTMKLTVDGGQCSEMAFTLEQALSQAPIRHVFLCYRANNIMGESAESWHPDRKIPFYLYSKSIMDDTPYLLSIDSFLFASGLFTGTLNWETNLDVLNYWQNKNHIKRQIQYNNKNNLKKLRRKINKAACNFTLNNNQFFPAAEHNLVRFIKNYPNIEFVIVFAPATRQSLAARGNKYLQRYFGVQNYLIRQTADLTNVTFHGFANDDRIVNNLANYRDTHHYHSGVNEYMLHAIAQDTHRLSTENIDSYIDEVADKLCNFEVHSDFSHMIPLALPNENRAFQTVLALSANQKLLNRSIAAIKKKKNTQALILLDQLLDTKELDRKIMAQAYAMRATGRARTNQPAKAIEDYTEAIRMTPGKAWLYIDRGVVQLKQNEMDKAIVDFRKAIDLRPNHFRAYWWMGRALVKKGRLVEAVAHYSKAIELSPHRAVLYAERGKVYQRLNNTIKAKNDFQKVLELNS